METAMHETLGQKAKSSTTAHWPYLLADGTGRRESLGAYARRGGYRALHNAVYHDTPANIVAAIVESSLTGKGGANFPTGKKWQMISSSQQTSRYVVCNGGEHEPGSRKDRALMEFYPHAVIEGTLIAAYAVGASLAYIYVTEEQAAAIDSISRGIQEARDQGYLSLGRNGHRFGCDLVCVAAPATYVAGEETAALDFIEGKDAKPRRKPPYPTEAGLFGKPTLINNVETLATIPVILNRGVKWFRSQGTEASPGAILVTLGAGVNRPGVYEVPFGTTLRSIIGEYGGGTIDGKQIKAILPGGPSLPFIAGDHLDVRMDHESLKAIGSGVGCGAIRLWLEDQCMVEATLEIAEFFAREQCGQCPLCRMETNTFAMVLKQLKVGQANGSYAVQIEKTAAFAHGKGICSLTNMAAAPVLAAMKLFKDDFDYHVEHGRCRYSG